jgi:hypothetical protein
MNTSSIVRGNRATWVVELAREAIDELMPKHVSLSEVGEFDKVADAWVAEWRGRAAPRALKMDDLVKPIEVEAMAAFLLIQAAQAVRDAIHDASHDEATDVVRSGLERILRRKRKQRTVHEPVAGNGAEDAAASPESGRRAAPADSSFDSEQLSRIHTQVYQRLLELDQSKQTASLYADAVVGVLVSRSGGERS